MLMPEWPAVGGGEAVAEEDGATAAGGAVEDEDVVRVGVEEDSDSCTPSIGML
jgi:hypothetical protein